MDLRRAAAQIGGLERARQLSPERRQEISRLAGEATLAKYGRAHYVRMNMAQQRKREALLAAGKPLPKRRRPWPAGVPR